MAVDNNSDAAVIEPDSFLDAFWHIGNPDPVLRNNASAQIISHCYSCGGDENKQVASDADVEYALTRLLRGVCGGKSGVRQGFASTLTSFISSRNQTVASKLKGKKDCICKDAACIREKLLECTDVDKGGASKLEERGSAFGRLFAILAIIRSGTLSSECTSSCKQVLIADYCNDIIGLYNFKKWMRESAAFALCELLTAAPQSVVNDMFDGHHEKSRNKTYMRVYDFVVQNHDGHPERLAVRFHVAKLLGSSSNLLKSIAFEELNEICMVGAHAYPRVHLIFEKILDIIPFAEGELEENIGNVFTALAESTVERKATILSLYHRLILISIDMNVKNFKKYEQYLENKNVLKLLFSNNDKQTLCKLGAKLRSEMFEAIGNTEFQTRYARIFYEFMPAKLFISLFYSRMNEESKITFVTNNAKLGDLHSFAKSDKAESIIKPLLKRLVDSAEDDEELSNKLFSCVNDLLANPNTADIFFPILNKITFPKSGMAKFDNNEKKLRFILKFYNKFGDVEFEENLDFENLSETSQNFAALLNHSSENTKLLRHFVRLNWIDLVKQADVIDTEAMKAICQLIGCGDADLSDDESSNGEDADLANLSLLDNDDESEGSVDDKDESMNTLDDQSLNSNDDSNAMEVEHDESADAALASMIALKQSMQKKGQENRARENFKDQIRCTMLLECVLKYAQKLVIDQSVILDLLSFTRKVERDMRSMDDLAEAKQLLEKLSSIFSQLAKIKTNITASEKYDLDVVTEVIKKSKSNIFAKICSSTIIFIQKNSLAEDTSVCKMMDELVTFWSQKHGPDFTMIFDDFSRFEETSEKALIKPLIKASSEGRSDFIKNASFSLLLKLIKETSSTNLLVGVIESCVKFLSTDEGRKSQHIVSCLKVWEKSSQLTSKRDDSNEIWTILKNANAEDTLKRMSEKHSKSQAILSRVKMLQSEIAAGLLIFNESNMDVTPSTPTAPPNDSSSKRSKKKSKSSKKSKK